MYIQPRKRIAYQSGALSLEETRQAKIDMDQKRMSRKRPAPMPRINAIDWTPTVQVHLAYTASTLKLTRHSS